MKRVLIVEGGGADGLYAIGALDYIIKIKELAFDAMFGTSIGGAICLGLASNYTNLKEKDIDKCESHHSLWMKSIDRLLKDMSKLSKWDLIKYPVLMGWMKGGYLRTNIKNVTNKLFAHDLVISDLAIYTEVFATDIDALNPIKSLRDGYRVDDACAITTNIPGVFAAYPDPFDNNRLFDGGVACNSPVANAVKYAKYNSIIDPTWREVDYLIIRLGSYKPAKKGGWLPATENLLQCFKASRYTCEQLSIKLGEALVGDDKHFTTISIPYELSLLQFDPKHNRENIEKGYEYAKWYYTHHPDR
jgi:hypothetical protein